MSVAELVPSWKAMPDPDGEIIPVLSLKGRKYRLRSSRANGIDLGSIMTARGVEQGSVEFLEPDLRRDMPNPLSLADMEQAAALMARMVRDNKRILVFGDYDVDGASSVAVIVRWARELGVDVDYYIPDRITEGYGPSDKAFGAARVNSYDLVVFVDCGTAAGELLDKIDPPVIVVDHHKPQGDLPKVHAVVNPHREDCSSGLGMLCAAALAFLFVVATQSRLREIGFFNNRPEPNRKNLLDIVALATVSDVVPLVGPSRLFVAKGMEVIASRPSPGISALMTAAAVKEISSNRIGFALGPRINAGGRVGNGSFSEDGALGVALLVAPDAASAMPIAARLNAMNGERQTVEKSALEEAMAQAEEQVAAGTQVICVYDSSWHPGVVGIVAGRIKERFNMPAIVGSLCEGVIKGSGRSVPGLDLGGIVIEARSRGLLASGGGHAMACGVGCKPEDWAEFVRFVNRNAKWTDEPVTVDCRVEASQLAADRISELSRLEPLGQGMPSVTAFIENFRVRDVRMFSDGHVRLASYQAGIEAVWWRARDTGFFDSVMALTGKTVALVGSPRINEWQGRRTIQIDIQDIIP